MNKKPFFKKKFFTTYKAVCYLCLLYLMVFASYLTIKYYSFSYFDFDLAEQAQSIKQILKGSLFSSILEANFLGNHARFILFLLAPFYFIFNSPLFLVYLQSLFIALSGIVIYRIATIYLKPKWGVLCTILFLLHPATICAQLYEFHTETLSVLFLSLMIFNFIKDRYKVFLVMAFFALLCKENMSLVIIMFGIFSFFKQKSLKWWLPCIIIGASYFIVYAMIIQPSYSGGNVGLTNMYIHLGKTLPEVLLNVITNPFKAFIISLTYKDITLAVQLLTPFVFLIFRPSWLFMVIPLFLQHFLSKRPSDHSIVYHYYAAFIPFLTITFILSVEKTLKILKHKNIKNVFFISLLIITPIISILCNPAVSYLRQPIEKLNNPLTNAQHLMLDSIPKNSTVCASMEFLPFLLENKKVYSFHYIVSNNYTLSYKKYKQPTDVDFLLFDTNNIIMQKSFIGKESHKHIKNFLQRNNLHPVDFYENIILFARNAKNIKPPISLLTEAPLTNNKDILFDTTLKLINANVRYEQAENLIDITLTFKTLTPPKEDYWIYFNTVSENKTIMDTTYMPLTFLLHPTRVWKKGDIFNIRHRILIDKPLTKGTYYLNFVLFNKKSQTVIPSDKNETLPNSLFKITIT